MGDYQDPASSDPIAANPDLQSAMAKEGITSEKPSEEAQESYQIIGSRIPVSKRLGSLWSARIDQSRAARRARGSEDAWSEAIRYYENDQTIHRTAQDDASGSRPARRIGRGWSETENVVFANCTTMGPMLYAKNPTIEVTGKNEEQYAGWADACKALINQLFSMKTNPGINLKPTVRRGILWCMLTNAAYSKVNWIKKADSSEQALEDLKEASECYAKAKTKKEIEEAEGKLRALEERVSLLSPSGASVSLVSPFRIFIDPTSIKGDHSDAAWMAEEDYLPTTYLNAVYGKDKDGKVVSLYEPTHILDAASSNNSSADLEGMVNNFTLFEATDVRTDMAKHYGYKSNIVFEKAQYTQVYWIWDKITRRVFLYAANKWDWPLWVWDDPLKLQEFFPYDHLYFHEAVEGCQPKGEVTYYLDQQDRINDNNAALAQARDWAKNNIFYNRNAGISQSEAEKILKGPNGTAVGIDVPEGQKMSDVIQSVTPPVMGHPELLSNDSAYEAINKITGISSAQQGAQFKTNTTNDAVNFYQKNVDIRVDDKIDLIEDWIGSIGWKLIQICSQNYTQEDVGNIIGDEDAVGWRQVTDTTDLRKHLNIRVVGGSTDKPTSKNKKQMAVEVVQVLGQFGNGIPAVGVLALKVLSRAFEDDIVITDEDWQMILQSLSDKANAAGGGPDGADGGGDPNAASGDPGQPGDPNADQASVVQQQVKDLMNKLPPEIKGKLQGLLDHGVPPAQALQQIQAQIPQQPTK